MPTFSPPVVSDVPPVLPEGDPEQSGPAFRLFRYYRARPRGLNVYVYRAGTVSAGVFGRVTEVDPVTTYTGGVATSDGWSDIEQVIWGGHAPVYVSDSVADALVAAGYDVNFDSDYLSADVVWFGGTGTFGATILATTATSQGHSFATKNVTWAWPAGHSVWIPALTDDGVLILPSTPQTSNAFRPTATSLAFGRWSPTSGTLTFETIPTSTGSTNPLSTSYLITGGADFEDIARLSGTERYILCVGRPNNDFIALDGDYPCFVVLSKQGGIWTYDAASSRTAAQMAATNPSAAAHIYTTGLNGAGVTITSNRNTTELSVFEDSGHTIVSHYDNASGAGYTGGALTLMDTSLDLLAGYLIPNVENPTGHPISVRARGNEVDPTSVSGDERVVIPYDVFDNAGTSPAGVLLDGSSNSSVTTPDSSTWNISGVIDIACRVRAADYSPSPSQFVAGHHEPTGNQRGYALFLQTTGALNFVASSGGGAANVSTNSSNASLTDGIAYWIGVSYNTVTGALTFYKHADQEAMPTIWSGWTTISTHTVTAVTPFDCNASLSIGATGSFLSSRFVGTVYRVALYDDGVLIADANFQGDGSPKATANSTGTYTDSLGNVWTLRGTARVDLANRFTFSEFSSDGSSITAVSAPITVADSTYRPEQVKFDEVGNLWVTTTFSGLFNGPVYIYEKTAGERSYVRDWPATTAAWLTGDGSTTSEYARAATPSATVAEAAIGSNAAGMVWDDDAKVMYVSAGGGILLAIGRTGAAAPYDYTFLGQSSFLATSAPGSNNITRPILDSVNGVVWIGVRQLSSGTYPYAPQVLDQWVVGIRTNFWE